MGFNWAFKGLKTEIDLRYALKFITYRTEDTVSIKKSNRSR